MRVPPPKTEQKWLGGHTEQTPQRKIKRWPLIVVAVLLVVGGAAFFLYPVYQNYAEYEDARKLLQDEQFEAATTAFAELGEYRDSSELTRESRYRQASGHLALEQFEQAAKLFKANGEYKDSKSLEDQAWLQLAGVYIRSKNYKTAIELLKSLDDSPDKGALLKEASLLQGRQLLQERNFAAASKTLKEAGNYKDAGTLLIEANYELGVEEFNKGNITVARDLLSPIENYKEVDKYKANIEKRKQFYGTWEAFSRQVVIDWNQIASVYFPDRPDTSVFLYDYTIEGNKLVTDNEETYERKGDVLIEIKYGKREEYVKISDVPVVPKEKPKPEIGMTANEVRDSNWGSPKDINKTTTEYGVREQWVYYGYKYIYLVDGVVTAIQD